MKPIRCEQAGGEWGGAGGVVGGLNGSYKFHYILLFTLQGGGGGEGVGWWNNELIFILSIADYENH